MEAINCSHAINNINFYLLPYHQFQCFSYLSVQIMPTLKFHISKHYIIGKWKNNKASISKYNLLDLISMYSNYLSFQSGIELEISKSLIVSLQSRRTFLFQHSRNL